MTKLLYHVLLVLCSLLLSSNLRAKQANEKILMVVTNLADMPYDQASDFWLPAASHPWSSFAKARFFVDFAAPAGDNAPIPPHSMAPSDPDNKRSLEENKGPLDRILRPPTPFYLESTRCAFSLPQHSFNSSDHARPTPATHRLHQSD